MSTLKTNNVQVGQSATATNNFTLYQPASPDGTVRLGVGNTGATTADALTVTNAGNATLLGNLTVSGTGTSTFAGTLNATTALQSGGVAASRLVQATALTGSGTGSLGWTGIPSWVKRITLSYTAIYNSSAGTVINLIQIGSGSYASSGYSSVNNNVTAANTVAVSRFTNGFALADGASSSFPISGMATLTLISANVWICNSQQQIDGATVMEYQSGKVTLAGALDRIQITPNGAFNISSGTANIIYEG